MALQAAGREDFEDTQVIQVENLWPLVRRMLAYLVCTIDDEVLDFAQGGNASLRFYWV